MQTCLIFAPNDLLTVFGLCCRFCCLNDWDLVGRSSDFKGDSGFVTDMFSVGTAIALALHKNFG